MTAIANAAGFGSLRQFNDTIRATFHRAPSELRGKPGDYAEGEVRLRLPYRQPFDWNRALSFLEPRALPGIEHVGGGVYRRVVGEGWIEVAPIPGDNALMLRTIGVEPGLLSAAAERTRIVFDLAADPLQVQGDLGEDPRLGPEIADRPGLRVLGAFSPFEMAIRVVLGQQVSVRGATTLTGRLIAAAGVPLKRAHDGLTHHFPTPRAVVNAEVDKMGMPGKRAAAVQALAAAVDEGELQFGAEIDPDQVREDLVRIPGIGPWTAEVIALRALGDPDAFPAGDLGLRKALGNGKLATEKAAEQHAEAWRPWRGYAAQWLWTEGPH